ncbi:MAG: DNA repair protein RecN [Pseudomonadaceae bacterium]|nr:DNA repair protein RecN [Pseudomonadaceae bacterium]
MLRQLTVANYALVDSLTVSLGGGLTVVTGESGAGKSIMLGALSLVLGNRSSADVVRPGAERADVSAEFDIAGNTGALALLDEHELSDADTCLIRRVVSREGRSRAFVNGVPVTLAVLSDIAAALIDIQAQDEHMAISQPSTQLKLLDDYVGDAKLIAGVAAKYREWHQSEAKATALRADIEAAKDRQELIRYQLEELDELGLAQDEFEEIERRFKRLTGAAQTKEALAQAMDGLDNLESLGRIHATLRSIDDNHPSLTTTWELLDSAIAQVDEANHELRAYADSLEFDDSELNELEKRLDRAQDLARKHKVRPVDLFEHTQGLREVLNAATGSETTLNELEEAADAARREFTTLAKKLSGKRRKAAKTFAKDVSSTMASLGIKGGKLLLEFVDDVSEHGLEKVDFQVITNPKYPAGSLAKVASGGERTRIALSIQVVAADRCKLPTLVLDEADVGIGGTTADVLGRLLQRLGSHCQVLCVTHAPQVAALGDTHLLVHKGKKQTSAITTLDEDGRLQELSRMLAGADVTDETRSYAATLLSDGALAASSSSAG